MADIFCQQIDWIDKTYFFIKTHLFKGDKKLLQ